VDNRAGRFCKALAISGYALMAAAQVQTPPAADAPPGASFKFAPVASLSPTQISACSEEISRMRSGWKYWPGEAGDAAARLGRFQKELFEGRCAGHPQARAYVTGANRMLTYASDRDHTTSPSLVYLRPYLSRTSPTK
jgi:hypothetical protein